MSVKKNDGSNRLSGDFKLTANQVTEYQEYAVSKTEDLFATLDGKHGVFKCMLARGWREEGK